MRPGRTDDLVHRPLSGPMNFPKLLQIPRVPPPSPAIHLEHPWGNQPLLTNRGTPRVSFPRLRLPLPPRLRRSARLAHPAEDVVDEDPDCQEPAYRGGRDDTDCIVRDVSRFQDPPKYDVKR